MTVHPGTLALAEPETDLDERVAVCVTVLGRELTAYVAGADSTDELDGWLDDADGDAGWPARCRLRAAFDVVEIFAAANRASLARGWLRQVGAAGDPARPPAMVIREARDEQPIKLVLQSARLFAQGGAG